MPLFQPSNITPSSFAGVGNGTVAVSDNVKITWQVNGNVAMTAYKIDIFDMNNKRSVYSSGIFRNGTPFYPTDNKGNPQYFLYESNATWGNLGLTDGNEYTLQITQYWGGVTDDSHSVTQFSQSAFITRTKPILVIEKDNGETDFSSIGRVDQEFKANYTQKQGDSIEWVRWKFYQDDYLVDDTGVVNTQVLKYIANNMRSGNNYKLVCTIQTENGVQTSTEKSFLVEYELPLIEGQFELNCFDKASNLLKWSKLQENVGDNIQGVSNDNNYSFEDGNLVLPQGSTVTWNTKNGESLNIPKDWTLAWKGSGNGLFNENIPNELNGKTNYLNESVDFIKDTLELKRQAKDIKYDKANDRFLLFSRSSVVAEKISYNGEITDSSIVQTGTTSEEINDIAIHPNGRLLVVVGDRFEESSGIKNSRIYQIENNTSTLIGTLPSVDGLLNDDTVYSVEFNENGDLLAISINKSIYFYVFDGTTFLYLTSVYAEGINAKFIFSSESKLFALNAGSGCKIYNVEKIKEHSVSFIAAIGTDYGNMKFSPTSEILIYGNQVYDIRDLNNIVLLTTVEGNVFGFNVSGAVFYQILNGGTSSLNKQYIKEYYIENNTVSLLKSRYFETSIPNYQQLSHSWICFGGNKIVFYGNCIIYKSFPYSITKSFSDGTIYNVIVNAINITDYKREFTKNTITISGEIPYYTNIKAMVTVYYLKGENTAIEERYVSINDIEIARYGNILNVMNKGNQLTNYTIPLKVKDVLVFINKERVVFSCDGVIVEPHISNFNYNQTDITSLGLYGEQTCEYLYITNGTATITDTFSPTWDNDTRFLTHFDISSLQGGQLDVAENSMDVYRENITTGEFEKLYSCKEDTTKMRDFSWITGDKYNYFGYAKLDDKYTSANLFNSAPICRNQPYYLLLATKQDEEQPNIYHVVHYWRFGNDIKAGDISNNNTPSFLNNFTGYRLKQATLRKGKSGTLTALLSNSINNEYKDTVQQMENLYALSDCNNPLFLKDMKGNLYMVSVSGAIIQTINTKSAYQEVKVSIPWEEIGSAKDVSIIQVPSDEGWVDDNAQLAEVRLEVDEETGMLKVVYPNDYNYTTTFGLVRSDLHARTADGVEESDLEIVDGAVILNGEE